MNFYYDPILGLQLTLGTTFYAIDIGKLPDEVNAFELLDLLVEKEITFVDSINFYEAVQSITKITNHKL